MEKFFKTLLLIVSVLALSVSFSSCSDDDDSSTSNELCGYYWEYYVDPESIGMGFEESGDYFVDYDWDDDYSYHYCQIEGKYTYNDGKLTIKTVQIYDGDSRYAFFEEGKTYDVKINNGVLSVKGKTFKGYVED